MDDEFDDIFFEEGENAWENKEEAAMKKKSANNNNIGHDDDDGRAKKKKKKSSTNNHAKKRGKNSNNDDDAISIGSSSSDDDSSTSSSSSSDNNNNDDDDSVISIPATKKLQQKLKDDDDSDVTIPLNNINPPSGGESKGGDNIGSSTDLDDDLDDEDLVAFFSQSPKPPPAASTGKKVEQKIEKEKTTIGYDLDDDDLADLEEEENDDSIKDGENVDKKNATTTKESTTAIKRDFTISYNCEKKEYPRMQEELIESSDEGDEENGSPNKKPKSNSSYFQKQHTNDQDGGDDESNDEILDLFIDNDEEKSLPVERKLSSPLPPDSPSSLDTPREQPDSPTSLDVEDDRIKEPTPLPKSANPYQNTNPYRKKKQQQQQQQQHQPQNQQRTAMKNDVHQNNIAEEQNVPSSKASSNNNNEHPSTSHVTTSGVVALPDLGLSSNAGQSEIDHLHITHSHFKPPPYSPRPNPIVHTLNSRTRPQNTRRTIAVDKVFSGPVQNLWKSSKFKTFNHVQSEMVNILANSDDNVIVSAPTGAGKTALFEMAMARLFSSNLTMRQGGIGSVAKTRKVVYVAPNKALCEERQADWSKRLADIDPNIVCTTITGDVNSTSSYMEITMANLILTTPEKWDSITRKWNDQFVLLSSIKLVLIDEAHLIGESDRGSTLESLISRMQTIQRAACVKTLSSDQIASSSYKNTTPEALTSNMRIVAVSATLPNLGQLASFVEAGEAYVFDQSYRPVPLSIYVQACGHIGNNRYLFDKSLNQHVPSILKRFSSGRPALVFCHSKKETEILAEELTKSYSCQRSNDSVLTNFAGKADSAALHRCIRKGMAFHHAGLDASDRRLVEEAFGQGVISCLCATSTLAMGVNLPSHLVVIKGTSAYRGAGNGHQDIDASSLLQMMGRAGRPGFDKTGVAVIMTDSLSKTRYENVSQGLKVVESHLESKLTEVFNVEISQGVITSTEDAVNWVKSSFLYQRIQSNPLFYGFNGKGNDALNSFILDKCTSSINKLNKIKAISVDDDGTFSARHASHIMSRNFIDFDTMKGIVKLPHDSGPIQLLHFMSNCTKIQTPIRRDDKKHLNEAYKAGVPKYKLEGPQSKVRVKTPAEKVFVMLQAAIGQYFFQDASLRQQMSHMIDEASQILSAIEQYAKEGSGNGQVAAQGMLFRRSLYSGLWGENGGVLNQIGGVTKEMATRLKGVGIITFADAVNSSNESLAQTCNVTTTFASSLRAAASKILQRTLKLSACSEKNDNGGLGLHIKLEPRVAGNEDTSERIVSYSLLVFTDRAGGLLHYSEEITNECEIRVQCPEKFGRAYIRLVSNLVGLDEQVTVDGNDKINKSSFSLTPAASKKKSSKGKKQSTLFSQPSTTASRKRRQFDSHRDSMSKVSDLRLHKRGKSTKDTEIEEEDDECIIVDPEAVEYEASSSRQTKQSDNKKSVTPSPYPRTKQQSNAKNLTPVRNTASSMQRSEKTTSRTPPQTNSKWAKNNANGNRRGPRNARSSWFQEKSQQKSSQQTAFHSPKENPFHSYSFDPNNIENSLTSTADKSKEKELAIIPNNISASSSSTTYSRATSSRPNQTTFRTPATHRRKSSAASNRISAVGLLQQKAQELQHHHAAATTSRKTNRGGSMMQHNNMADASSVHLGYPTGGRNDGRMMMNQYDPNNMMMSQDNYFDGGGSVMMNQSFDAPEPSLTPPGPSSFMGGLRNNSSFAGHQNNSMMMRGPMAGATSIRPMSSAGQSIASRLRMNHNFGQANIGGNMIPQQQHQQQQHFQSVQPRFFQPQMQQHVYNNRSPYDGNTEFAEKFYSQQGMSGYQPRQHYMHQGHQQQQQQEQQFDDSFNEPFGLDPSGDVGFGGAVMSIHGGNPSFAFGNAHTNSCQDNNPSMRDMSNFSGNQFGGGGHATVHNPYQQPTQQQQQLQQQQLFQPRHFQPSNNPLSQQRQPPVVNPYAQQRQQHLGFNAATNDNPPMQEVVVKNHTGSVAGSGLVGDDTVGNFEDAFLN